MTQFSSLQDRVLAYGFSDSKYRVDIGTWLNEGARKVAEKTDIRDFFAQETITTTTQANAMPTDFLRLSDVKLTTDASNPSTLEEMELSDFDNSPASTGTPYYYLVIGTQLYFYPTPDSEITAVISYYRRPVEMVEGTDSPEGVLTYYEDVLVSWALKRAYEREADPEMASYWTNDFYSGLNDLQGQLQTDTESGPRYVKGMWEVAPYPQMVIPR